MGNNWDFSSGNQESATTGAFFKPATHSLKRRVDGFDKSQEVGQAKILTPIQQERLVVRSSLPKGAGSKTVGGFRKNGGRHQTRGFPQAQKRLTRPAGALEAQ